MRGEALRRRAVELLKACQSARGSSRGSAGGGQLVAGPSPALPRAGALGLRRYAPAALCAALCLSTVLRMKSRAILAAVSAHRVLPYAASQRPPRSCRRPAPCPARPSGDDRRIERAARRGRAVPPGRPPRRARRLTGPVLDPSQCSRQPDRGPGVCVRAASPLVSRGGQGLQFRVQARARGWLTSCRRRRGPHDPPALVKDGHLLARGQAWSDESNDRSDESPISSGLTWRRRERVAW